MPHNLMVRDLKKNRKKQEKWFNRMCNVGVRVEGKGGVRRVSDALDVVVMADKFFILNPSPLETTIGYIVQDEKGEGYQKKCHRGG